MHFSGVEKFQNVLLLGSCIDYDNEKILFEHTCFELVKKYFINSLNPIAYFKI